MEFSRLTTWIGLTGLAVALTGCPGGDDTGTDTMADTGTVMTSTTTNGSSTTTDETTANGTTTTAESTGGESTGDASTGPTVDDSSGDPPSCGLGVMLMFPNPACGTCLEANCCMELQTCFGDETIMMETECLLLNNCIATNCQGVMPADLQACIDMNCMDNAGAMPDWTAYQVCAGQSCLADCS